MIKNEGSLTNQLTNNLLNLIKKSDSGNKFPPEMELSRRYKVCRNTVREAIRNLVDEGYLYRIQGKGTFVTRHKIPFEPKKLMKFSTTAIDHGFQPATQYTNVYEMYADEIEFLADKLKIEANDGVWCLEFIRYIDNTPLIYTTSYLPIKKFPDLDRHLEESFSLYDVLDSIYKTGEIIKESYTLEVGMPEKDDMKALKIPKSIPVFILKSRSLDINNDIVDYRISRSRSDLIKFKLDA